MNQSHFLDAAQSVLAKTHEQPSICVLRRKLALAYRLASQL